MILKINYRQILTRPTILRQGTHRSGQTEIAQQATDLCPICEFAKPHTPKQTHELEKK